MPDLKLLELELLKTLSFFEPMSSEFIFIDLDNNFLQQNPEYTLEDLESALSSLLKQKKIKKIKSNGHYQWIKLYPKKSFLKRFISFFTK